MGMSDEGKILRERVAPSDLVYSRKHYRREMRGGHGFAGSGLTRRTTL